MKILYLSIPQSDWVDLVTFKITDYLITRNEFFSLVYYYNPDEPMSETCEYMHQRLRRLVVVRERTNRWPGTNILDMNKSAYYVVEYYDTIGYEEQHPEWGEKYTAGLLLELGPPETKEFRQWDFPERPMDLCFYKDGVCTFSVTAHENLITLFTDSDEEIQFILHAGDAVKQAYPSLKGATIPNPTVEKMIDDPTNNLVYYIPKHIMSILEYHRTKLKRSIR